MRDTAITLKQRGDMMLSVNHVGQGMGIAMLY